MCKYDVRGCLVIIDQQHMFEIISIVICLWGVSIQGFPNVIADAIAAIASEIEIIEIGTQHFSDIVFFLQSMQYGVNNACAEMRSPPWNGSHTNGKCSSVK